MQPSTGPFGGWGAVSAPRPGKQVGASGPQDRGPLRASGKAPGETPEPPRRLPAPVQSQCRSGHCGEQCPSPPPAAQPPGEKRGDLSCHQTHSRRRGAPEKKCAVTSGVGHSPVAHPEHWTPTPQNSWQTAEAGERWNHSSGLPPAVTRASQARAQSRVGSAISVGSRTRETWSVAGNTGSPVPQVEQQRPSSPAELLLMGMSRPLRRPVPAAICPPSAPRGHSATAPGPRSRATGPGTCGRCCASTPPADLP